MTPQQFASELRPGNLLLIPDYNATYSERSPTGFVMHTFAIVLRATEDIISNLTAPKSEREAYHPMYLREDAFRFLGFKAEEGSYSFQLPEKDISISWTAKCGIVITESGVVLKTNIRFAHQLQNHLLETYDFELKGTSTAEMPSQLDL